jgi:hypothetical protein
MLVFLRLFIQSLLVLPFFLLNISCSPEENTNSSTDGSEAPVNCIVSGDIVVSNSGSDSLVVLNSDGTFKTMAFNVPSATENLYGITWSALTGEILVAVDGVDRVVAVDPVDCSNRTVVLDVNLTGTIRGITQLTSGDILISETNNIERFGSNGNRVAAGWPLAAQTAASGLSALSNGGFVHCSTTTDVVRTYSSTGVQAATRSSGIAGTTDAMDCFVMSNGQIVTTWSGTSDTVSIYTSTLTPVTSFSNTAYLAAPGGIAQRANGGNLLVVDRTYNHIVEITTAGVLVGTFGSGLLSTPEFILVVP